MYTAHFVSLMYGFIRILIIICSNSYLYAKMIMTIRDDKAKSKHDHPMAIDHTLPTAKVAWLLVIGQASYGSVHMQDL